MAKKVAIYTTLGDLFESMTDDEVVEAGAEYEDQAQTAYDEGYPDNNYGEPDYDSAEMIEMQQGDDEPELTDDEGYTSAAAGQQDSGEEYFDEPGQQPAQAGQPAAAADQSPEYYQVNCDEGCQEGYDFAQDANGCWCIKSLAPATPSYASQNYGAGGSGVPVTVGSQDRTSAYADVVLPLADGSCPTGYYPVALPDGSTACVKGTPAVQSAQQQQYQAACGTQCMTGFHLESDPDGSCWCVADAATGTTTSAGPGNDWRAAIKANIAAKLSKASLFQKVKGTQLQKFNPNTAAIFKAAKDGATMQYMQMKPGTSSGSGKPAMPTKAKVIITSRKTTAAWDPTGPAAPSARAVKAAVGKALIKAGFVKPNFKVTPAGKKKVADNSTQQTPAKKPVKLTRGRL